MLEINKKNIAIVAIIVIIIIVIIIINMTQTEEKEEDWIEEVELTQETEPEEHKKIKIHITGEVINKGIVEINEGGRIIDAIEKAGGTTQIADLSKINLAYVLEDGQKVNIPSINDKQLENEEQYITQENQENVIVGENLSKKTEKRININTANEQELQNLQGIGETMAKRIVEYRKANGKFKEIEDLKNVKGIGNAKYDKIKQNICVK